MSGPWPNFQIVEEKYKVADVKGIVLAAFFICKFQLDQDQSFIFSHSPASIPEPMVHTTVWTSDPYLKLTVYTPASVSNRQVKLVVSTANSLIFHLQLAPDTVFPISGTGDSILHIAWAKNLEVILDSFFLSCSISHGQ